jgi:hypothetical protein
MCHCSGIAALLSLFWKQRNNGGNNRGPAMFVGRRGRKTAFLTPANSNKINVVERGPPKAMAAKSMTARASTNGHIAYHAGIGIASSNCGP